MKRFLSIIVCGLACANIASSQPIATNGFPAIIERGTYHNYFSCQNPAYAVFAHFGDDSGADSRLGQFLVGWDTTQIVPTNYAATHYLIRHCRITITLNNGNQIVHDPSHDAYQTYFSTNDPAWLPDADAGRPIELFGVSFRNGYSATNFDQCSPVGSGGPGSDNVFAISWSTNGAPADVANNVGKSAPEFPPFETWPFAVAQTDAAVPGNVMPAGAKLTFDLNLEDPFLVGYLQSSLQQGRLNFMVSSLHEVSGQFGSEPYPAFTTRFNQAILDPPTTLDLAVTVIRDLDTDLDRLPDDWEQFYFTNLVQNAEDDFDVDSAKNEDELLAGTNPLEGASVFRIDSLASSEGKTLLRWPNLPNRAFSIESSDDLVTWQIHTNPPLIFPSPNVAEWADQNPANTHRFLRVQAHTH